MSRQHGSPRSLIRPAPNSTRNSSQRASSIVSSGGPTSSLPSKTAIRPASKSNDSHTSPYQRWPTLTIDRYRTHSTTQISIVDHNGTTSSAPTTIAADTAAPTQQTTANIRSE